MKVGRRIRSAYVCNVMSQLLCIIRPLKIGRSPCYVLNLFGLLGIDVSLVPKKTSSGCDDYTDAYEEHEENGLFPVWVVVIGLLVDGASICILNLENSDCAPDMGRMRSSMVRSDEFLNTLIRTTCGILDSEDWLLCISSLMMEKNGVIPLPPLTITNKSCL
nr:hypothetical protein B296_00055892 [Ipomoea batatas]